MPDLYALLRPLLRRLPPETAHDLTLRGLARTFTLVPLTHGPHLASMTVGVEQAFGSIFVSALEVAAPVTNSWGPLAEIMAGRGIERTFPIGRQL